MSPEDRLGPQTSADATAFPGRPPVLSPAGTTVVPPPAEVAERALVDVRPRTAPAMPA